MIIFFLDYDHLFCDMLAARGTSRCKKTDEVIPTIHMTISMKNGGLRLKLHVTEVAAQTGVVVQVTRHTDYTLVLLHDRFLAAVTRFPRPDDKVLFTVRLALHVKVPAILEGTVTVCASKMFRVIKFAKCRYEGPRNFFVARGTRLTEEFGEVLHAIEGIILEAELGFPSTLQRFAAFFAREMTLVELVWPYTNELPAFYLLLASEADVILRIRSPFGRVTHLTQPTVIYLSKCS